MGADRHSVIWYDRIPSSFGGAGVRAPGLTYDLKRQHHYRNLRLDRPPSAVGVKCKIGDGAIGCLPGGGDESYLFPAPLHGCRRQTGEFAIRRRQ